jgi:hypothetical protein
MSRIGWSGKEWREDIHDLNTEKELNLPNGGDAILPARQDYKYGLAAASK